MQQCGRPEQEARVAPVDVVLDDLGVERADSHHRHSDDPVGVKVFWLFAQIPMGTWEPTCSPKNAAALGVATTSSPGSGRPAAPR